MSKRERERAQTLRADHLTIGWSGRPVAEDVSLSVGKGSICAIAGPNGVGKSTLLKTMARQITPLSGQVRLDEADVWTLTPQSFARQVSFVAQGLDSAQDLTVSELAMLGRSPHQPWWSWSCSDEDRQAVRDALERTDAWHLKDKYLSSLSGGERQRAMIASALAQRTDFMLLDEPTSHLDFRHQLELTDLLKELSAGGLGVVVVLHDLNLISRLADQVVLLKEDSGGPSRVAACGTPPAVLETATLRDVYGVEVSIARDTGTGLTVYTPTRCASRSEGT